MLELERVSAFSGALQLRFWRKRIEAGGFEVHDPFGEIEGDGVSREESQSQEVRATGADDQVCVGGAFPEAGMEAGQVGGCASRLAVF